MNTTEEKWLPVEESGGRYEISDHGNARNAETGRVLATPPDDRGYPRCDVWMESEKGSVRKNRKVHRLVAKAFIPNPDGKPEVNHIDGCKGNNAAVNLEWATRSENMRHSYKMGLHKSGADSPVAKLNDEAVARIWQMSRGGCSLRQIARVIGGISHGAIHGILNRKTWTGYIPQQPQQTAIL